MSNLLRRNKIHAVLHPECDACAEALYTGATNHDHTCAELKNWPGLEIKTHTAAEWDAFLKQSEAAAERVTPAPAAPVDGELAPVVWPPLYVAFKGNRERETSRHDCTRSWDVAVLVSESNGRCPIVEYAPASQLAEARAEIERLRSRKTVPMDAAKAQGEIVHLKHQVEILSRDRDNVIARLSMEINRLRAENARLTQERSKIQEASVLCAETLSRVVKHVTGENTDYYNECIAAADDVIATVDRLREVKEKRLTEARNRFEEVLRFLQRLQDGGSIVSSAYCDTAEIVCARDARRMHVDPAGFGYVYRAVLDGTESEQVATLRARLATVESALRTAGAVPLTLSDSLPHGHSKEVAHVIRATLVKASRLVSEHAVAALAPAAAGSGALAPPVASSPWPRPDPKCGVCKGTGSMAIGGEHTTNMEPCIQCCNPMLAALNAAPPVADAGGGDGAAFCACGRRKGECDGSRKGCATATGAGEGGEVSGSERAEIVAWLRGLEATLGRVISETNDPEMRARRGIYDGIADDIERGAHMMTAAPSGQGGRER